MTLIEFVNNVPLKVESFRLIALRPVTVELFDSGGHRYEVDIRDIPDGDDCWNKRITKLEIRFLGFCVHLAD